MTMNRKQLTKELRTIAAQLEESANRADTLDLEDERRKQAAQVRAAALVVKLRLPNAMDAGEAFIVAGKLMLVAHEKADMDAVHASRSNRRAAR